MIQETKTCFFQDGSKKTKKNWRIAAGHSLNLYSIHNYLKYSSCNDFILYFRSYNNGQDPFSKFTLQFYLDGKKIAQLSSSVCSQPVINKKNQQNALLKELVCNFLIVIVSLFSIKILRNLSSKVFFVHGNSINNFFAVLFKSTVN